MWDDNAWDEMRRLKDKMSHMFGDFGDFWSGDRPRATHTKLPNFRTAWVDFQEEGDHYMLEIELPGINKENIKLSITERDIEIKASKTLQKEIKNEEAGTIAKSKSYSGFYRVISMPEFADTTKVDAVFKNGILTVKVGKKDNPVESSNTKTIDIK